jgi:hypothetical protein
MKSEYLRWWNVREAYRAVFQRAKPKRDHINTLMADLAEFCRANTSCVVVGKDGHIDTHATALVEGRREVFLRIQATLNITDEQLLQMKGLEDDN